MMKKDEKKREIFDRIRSAFERKQLFLKLIEEGGELLCKGDTDALFHFKPSDVDENEGIIGIRTAIEGTSFPSDNIVANFRVGEDRYFMLTSFIQIGKKEMLLFSDQLFKLQRRAHNRVDFDDKIENTFQVIKFNNKKVFFDAKGLDISAGGARVAVAIADAHLAEGDRLAISCHIKNKWRFEIEGEIRHIYTKENIQIFGLQFDVSNIALANKIQMMMLDLQRWVVLNINK